MILILQSSLSIHIHLTEKLHRVKEYQILSFYHCSVTDYSAECFPFLSYPLLSHEIQIIGNHRHTHIHIQCINGHLYVQNIMNNEECSSKSNAVAGRHYY